MTTWSAVELVELVHEADQLEDIIADATDLEDGTRARRARARLDDVKLRIDDIRRAQRAQQEAHR